MLNLWRPIWLCIPRKSGWYLCTIKYGYDLDRIKTIELYFNRYLLKWSDPRRQTVFEGYRVFSYSKMLVESNRIYTDSDCTFTNILAWKRLPKPYGWIRKRGGNRVKNASYN